MKAYCSLKADKIIDADMVVANDNLGQVQYWTQWLSFAGCTVLVTPVQSMLRHCLGVHFVIEKTIAFRSFC